MTGIEPVYLAARCALHTMRPWPACETGDGRMNRAALLLATAALTDWQNSGIDALRIVKVNHT